MNIFYDGMDPEEKKLCDLMIELSERCWCAGWLDGTEYHLWALVTKLMDLKLSPEDLHWGQDTIEVIEVIELAQLARRTKKWIVYSDHGEVAVDLKQWNLIYDERMWHDIH